MAFPVRFTAAAREDLRALHAYISAHDSRENADYVTREIVRAALALRDLPKRGAYPPELLRMGSRSYRQILFKPYRIFYRVSAGAVYIALIADGRRNLQALLVRRLTDV